MYKNNNSDTLLSYTVNKNLDLSEEVLAYIHFNLFMYAKIDSSKVIALKLYKHLYKKSDDLSPVKTLPVLVPP